MLTRQKIAIRLLQQCGGEATRLQLTKLLFLIEQETPGRGGSAFYRFLPYKFGPYSFSLTHEIGQLERDGMVRDYANQWRLTTVGHSFEASLAPNLEADVLAVRERYGLLSASELRQEVYERYPWFTLLSELEGQRAVDRPVAEPAIYTVGYEGMTVDGFLDLLLRKGIVQLIDVRSNPVSRRFGFHKQTLLRLCRSIGIDYKHFPELGIPSERRIRAQSSKDVIALLNLYERDTLSQRIVESLHLVDILEKSPSALMCMEADPSLCHRSRLARHLETLSNLPVIHLEGQR